MNGAQASARAGLLTDLSVAQYFSHAAIPVEQLTGQGGFVVVLTASFGYPTGGEQTGNGVGVRGASGTSLGVNSG